MHATTADELEETVRSFGPAFRDEAGEGYRDTPMMLALALGLAGDLDRPAQLAGLPPGDAARAAEQFQLITGSSDGPPPRTT